MASDVAELAPAGAPARKDAIASIAGQIESKTGWLSNGDRAQLRRLYLTQTSSSRSAQGDGVVIGLLHHADVPVPERVASFERWKLIAHVAALLSGTGGQPSHRPHARVGRALQEAGYSENRLLRLLAARGGALADQIVRVARVLAQAGKGPVDLWTLFDLTNEKRDVAEAARLRIAKDFYAAQAASN